MNDFWKLVVAASITLGLSAVCSILEAMILSTSASDIESLRQKHAKLGDQLAKYKEGMEETSSAILTLNTIANTLGATLVGGLAQKVYGEQSLMVFSIGLTIGILLFSEILPKNAGVIYRRGLQPALVPLLGVVRWWMAPLAKVCSVTINFVIPKKPEEAEAEDEIILLAEKSAKEGSLSMSERDMISNALSLDETNVGEIMTPRTVVMAVPQDTNVRAFLADNENNVPFARLPVYEGSIDKVVGIIRRREILLAMATGQADKKIQYFMQKPTFVPEMGTVEEALKSLQTNNQQLAVVVDEFGSTAGVLALEDIFEHILGQEFYEKDDPAEDMRELAKQKQDART
jgi:CBS domain containing-hemolysin-like protein